MWIFFKHGDELLPHLSRLRDEFTRRETDDWEKAKSTVFQMEQLPYALGATCLAVSELIAVQRDIVQRILGTSGHPPGTQILLGEDRDLMGFKVDNFLESARRTQNALIPYLGRVLSCQLPLSLSDLIKKVHKGDIVFPEFVTSELLTYWQQHGERVKFYRDLSQHHALIASDARAFLDEGVHSAVSFVLPNNPEVKNASQLKWVEPSIDALPYVRTEFAALFRFTYRVTRFLIDQVSMGKTFVRAIVLKAPARIEGGKVIGGHRLATQEEFQREVAQLARTLREEVDNEFGNNI